MKGLTRDFIHNGRTMMILDKDGGITRSDLSQLQLNMIMSNDIPGHLKMHVKEVDSSMTLSYDITGQRMLSHRLKSEKLSLYGLFYLLQQLAHILMECRQYMLDEHQYILHEDYIFIKGEIEEGKLNVCYVPSQAQTEQDKISAQLYQLIVRLMPHVQTLEGSGLQKILHLCSNDHFRLASLNEMLLELLTKESLGKEVSAKEVLAKEGLGTNLSPSQHQQISPSRAVHFEQDNKASLSPSDQKAVNFNNQINASVGKGNPFSISSPFTSNENSLFKSEVEPIQAMKEMPVKKMVNPMYCWLGCLLTSSVLWRFIYMDEPNSVRLTVCIVLTVISVIAAYLLSKGKGLPFISNKTSEADQESDDEQQPSRNKWFASRKKQELSEPWPKEPAVNGAPLNDFKWNAPSVFEQVGREERSSNHSNRSIEEFPKSSAGSEIMAATLSSESLTEDASYYAALKHNTQFLTAVGRAQATVLLSEPEKENNSVRSESVISEARSAQAYLERVSPEGTTDSIKIGSGSFVIGRSAEVAGYVEEGTGTSRAHVEISKSKAGYAIKDLNSMNGTLFQEELMVPYKEYPLQNGDSFIISKSKYTFYLTT
ncbi:FHA domain-containing protein [Neobacillus mesonae]|nr:FHA domain-containing protein [Neobacillus mesonae]